MTVACFFDNGNSPFPFRLLDKSGQEVKGTSNKGYVRYSFAVKCEDDWPIIRCEGAGSEFNRSVSFLVKCKFNNFLSFLNNTSFMSCVHVYFCSLFVLSYHFVFPKVCSLFLIL